MGNDVTEKATELVCKPATRAALDQYAAKLRQRSPATRDRYERTLTPLLTHLIATRQRVETIDSVVLERYAGERYARAKMALGADEPAKHAETANEKRLRELANRDKCQQAQDRVNREFDVINAFIRTMVDSGIIARSPGLLGFRYRHPDVPVTAKPAPTALSDDKWFPDPVWQRLQSGLQAAIANARTEPAKRYFWLWEYRIAIIYGLGLRASEALEHSYANLSDNHGVPRLTVTGKGRKTREITVDRATAEAMAGYLRSLKLDLATATTMRLPLIPGRSAEQSPSRHSLYTSFQTLQERLGWVASERRELHALRHTRATHLASVLTLTELMKFLGHSRAETTQIYFHDNAAMLDRMNSLHEKRA